MKYIFIGILASLLIIAAYGEEHQQETEDLDSAVSFEKLKTSEFEISEVQYYEWMKEASYYNFDTKGIAWLFKEINCSLIKNAHIVKGTRAGAELHPSQFTVISFKNSKRIYIIPLTHGMFITYGEPYRDAHNWAYFSEVIEGEEIEFDVDENWLSLAVCFVGMTMTDALPNVVTKENINEIFGNDAHNFLQMLPRVERGKSLIEVSFYDMNRFREFFTEWHLEFKPGGFLIFVSKELLSKADLIKKLESEND